MDPLGLGGWSWNPLGDAQTLRHDTANLLNCVADGSSCIHRVEANAAIGAINAASSATGGNADQQIPIPFPCQPGSGLGVAAFFGSLFFIPGVDEAAGLNEGLEGAVTEAGSVAPDLENLSPKIESDLLKRGWTPQEIQEAYENGEQVPAINKANGEAATRYINPTTGKSVVIENGTGEVIHVGGAGFKYGPGSGDLP